MKLPTQKYLQECFYYNAKTGKLFWKNRPEEHFESTAACNEFNRRFKDTALNSFWDRNESRFMFKLDNVRVKKDAVIYKLVTSEEPESIHHKNNNNSDDKFNNLSPVHAEERFIPFYTFAVCWNKTKKNWLVQELFNLQRSRSCVGTHECKSREEALTLKQAKEWEAKLNDNKN